MFLNFQSEVQIENLFIFSIVYICISILILLLPPYTTSFYGMDYNRYDVDSYPFVPVNYFHFPKK